MFALHIDYQSGSCIHNITELFEVAGRTSLRATGSIRFDIKTKRVLTKLWQLSMAVLNFFSKFVKGLPIQGTLKYIGRFLGPNRSRGENLAIFLTI